MKNILITIMKWISEFFSFSILVKSLAIGNLSFLYADSVNYLKGMYGINLASLGMMTLLFTFYFCQFIKNLRRLRMDDVHIQTSMKYLKVFVIIIALAPVVINQDFSLVNYQHDTLRHAVKSFFELVKVFGAEKIVGICLWLEQKSKSKK